jgi:F0F1-type ATP synthase assembly protein I
LIGLFLDWALGTTPIMTILWLLAGVGVGFWRMWQRSEHLEQEGRERSHGA